MQPLRVAFVAVLLLSATVAPTSASAVSVDAVRSKVRAGLSPVTQVVELLKSLAESIEKEGKKEEDLYETFVCWAKSIMSQKEKSNAAAQSRADTLKSYIADLDAGRIELTTERADLTKQVAELNADMESATQMRNKENTDFLEAKDEMQKAINALTEAIEVLTTATQNHTEGVLLEVQAKEGYTARAEEASSLRHAADLGERMLSRGDAVFLRRVLTGEAEVPNPDWKKLNRKATFKMDYKARSFKIQSVLEKMLETFESNLEDAEKKEADAVALYDKLMTAKGGEKSAAEQALTDMVKENGARGMSKDESQAEVDALTTQISNDEGYIQQVSDALAAKKQEWKDRMTLRSGELGAISKAIEVLHNDDARDLFKKSFTSQGYLFFQEASTSQHRSDRAIAALRHAATDSHDTRLVALARSVNASHFTEVVEAIDNMLALLQQEENTDLKTKEDCEKHRADDTREAIDTSRKMDELSDSISEAKAKIADLTSTIKEKEDEIEAIIQELAEARRMRKDEHAEYLVAKKDDEDAATTILSAKSVLEDFYRDNQLVFVQRSKAGQPFVSQAGEAPPPPPTTWENPNYGGRTEESGGIVAILGMIHEDVVADIAKADKEELAAQTLYDTTKSALETEQGDLEGEIQTLQGTIGTLESGVSSDTTARGDKKDDLDVVMKRIADTAPHCDYYAINYPLRVKNRQMEVDGLLKAKAILTGGVFDPEDPNRELKPGDAALLQGRLRGGRRQSKLTAA